MKGDIGIHRFCRTLGSHILFFLVRVYEPLDKVFKIQKVEFSSEFEIQAELYQRLKADGFDVQGEVNVQSGVFDLVVFGERGFATAIIETKRPWTGSSLEFDETEQGWKYRQFGVPVILFWDFGYYDDLLTLLRAKRIMQTKYYKDLVEIANAEKLGLTPDTRNLKKTCAFRLVRFLDRASMAAFDMGVYCPEFSEAKAVEQDLETKKQKAKVFLESLN